MKITRITARADAVLCYLRDEAKRREISEGRTVGISACGATSAKTYERLQSFGWKCLPGLIVHARRKRSL